MSENCKGARPHSPAKPNDRWRAPLLTFLKLAQLILYILLLALLGQGRCTLAGPRRDGNVFYRLLQLLSRLFTPRRAQDRRARSDHQVPIVFFLVVIARTRWSPFEKIDLCMKVGLEQCR